MSKKGSQRLVSMRVKGVKSLPGAPGDHPATLLLWRPEKTRTSLLPFSWPLSTWAQRLPTHPTAQRKKKRILAFDTEYVISFSTIHPPPCHLAGFNLRSCRVYNWLHSMQLWKSGLVWGWILIGSLHLSTPFILSVKMEVDEGCSLSEV